MEYEIHPAAMLFPMMDSDTLQKLSDDIKENGLLDPILIYDYKIIDGRNRLAACERVGVEPRFAEVQNIDSPTLFVLSKNLHRRHLSVSQRAAIGAEMIPMLAEEANERKLSGLKNQQHSSSAPIGADEEPAGRSREIVAKSLAIGTSSVDRAIKVKKENPEVFERVKRGEITVNAAADGHTEQPVRGGQLPNSTDTKRGVQVAEAAKRRMIDGLSVVSGCCHGLENLDASRVASVCSPEEIETWATKAETHARELRRFAARLREEQNGKH